MKNDLEKYAERKMPFFNLSVSLWSHYLFLEETFGEGFSKSIFVHKEGVCILNASKKQTRDVVALILKKLRTHDPLFARYYAKAKEMNSRADELLKKYENNSVDLTRKNFDNAFEVFANNFSYCTILPYWVLYAINQVLESGAMGDDFTAEQKMYEELKGETRYPQLVQGVMSRYFKKAAELLGISVEHATCVTPDELALILDGKKVVSPEELSQRWMRCAITPKEVPYKLNFNFDESYIDGIVGSSASTGTTEVKGSIAYKGVVRGRAKIVNTIDDMKKFEEGDVLISIQSSPSLMPAIRICSALVTDEGGIMCHASIISRELKKPCIIGTKIATKIFKDGDMVEVDAEKGIVKILS